MYKALFYVIFLCCWYTSFSQSGTQVDIKHADELIFIKNESDAKRLIGHVKIQHDTTILTCDSAYIYDFNQKVVAYGNIRINHADSIFITGDSLDYDGKTKIAHIKQNVKMRDQDINLETDQLDYDLKNQIGYYIQKANITSAKNNNKLTSIRGYYYSASKTFEFKDSVFLENPKYTMVTDTLKYNTVSEVAYFYGPTTILADSNTLYCENGWYDTKNDVSEFNENAYLFTNSQKLYGQKLYYDRKSGIGIAKGDITIEDSTNQIILNGDTGVHYEKANYSLITGKAILTKIMTDDSLFLRADTLTAINDSLDKKIVKAYYSAKLFKSDMQAVSDSIVYLQSDSSILLFDNPIVWTDSTQLKGDTIKILLANDKLHKINSIENSFIIQQLDSVHFNQIKGKNLVGNFIDQNLDLVWVNGNGESIYFVNEEGEAPFSANYIKCGKMKMKFLENEIDNIWFFQRPVGTLNPIQKLEKKEQFLDNFDWKAELKPKRKDVFGR